MPIDPSSAEPVPNPSPEGSDQAPVLLPIGPQVEQTQPASVRWYAHADQIVLAVLAVLILLLIGCHWYQLRGKKPERILIETAEVTTPQPVPATTNEEPIRVQAMKPNFDQALLQEPKPLPAPVRPPKPKADPYTLQLDLNSADWLELSQLPGIGEVLARRIVSHREYRGPFQSVEDVQKVRGIGRKTLEKIQPYLRVEP